MVKYCIMLLVPKQLLLLEIRDAELVSACKIYVSSNKVNTGFCKQQNADMVQKETIEEKTETSNTIQDFGDWAPLNMQVS